MVNASNRVFAPGTGRSAGMIFGIAIIAAFYINAGAARASLRGRRDTSAHHIAGVSVPGSWRCSDGTRSAEAKGTRMRSSGLRSIPKTSRSRVPARVAGATHHGRWHRRDEAQSPGGVSGARCQAYVLFPRMTAKSWRGDGLRSVSQLIDFLDCWTGVSCRSVITAFIARHLCAPYRRCLVPRKLAVLGRHSLGRSEGYTYA
jgi:hypothetical protein